jgi:hypothetical protein
MVLFVAGAEDSLELYDRRASTARRLGEFPRDAPGLRNEILVAFVLTTINALRSFDIIYNTTAGGPGNTTIVPSMYMYQNAFLFNRVVRRGDRDGPRDRDLRARRVMLRATGAGAMGARPLRDVPVLDVHDLAITRLSILFLALHRRATAGSPSRIDLSSFRPRDGRNSDRLRRASSSPPR